jgi:hypothetical protein
LDYARGGLSAEERAVVAAHLSEGCRSCQENHRWLEEAVQLTAADKSYPLPEELILQVVAQFRAQSTASQSPLRRFFAQLMFDSFLSRQLIDVRSIPPGGSAVVGRQLHYQTEGYDIDLRFERPEGAEAEEMTGQVFPRESQATQQARPVELAHLSAQLLQGEVEIGCAETDARGVFRFAEVQSGTYNLKIRVPEGEINIDAVATARAAS